MKERPILFSGPMVRAILDGRKTQTRRLMKPQPEEHPWSRIDGYRQKVRLMPSAMSRAGSSPTTFVRVSHHIPHNLHEDGVQWIRCPHGQPGDRLWVRETHHPREIHCCGESGCDCALDVEVFYPADGGRRVCRDTPEDWTIPDVAQRGGNVPSIHMPRWACRILLEITSVRVEKLQDISEADAQAEGVYEDEKPGFPVCSKRQWFRVLWESINGADSWNANPWVWVVEFRKVPHETD